MGLAHSPRIVTNGLVLCLDAANRKSYPGSGTTWTDISRRGNNGTLINGATFSSANGGAIFCDGVDDYISLPTNSINTNIDSTLDFWVMRETGSPNATLLSGFGSGTNGYLQIRMITSNHVSLVWSQNLELGNFGSSTATIDDRVYQIVIVRQTGVFSCYLNSILAPSTLTPGVTFTTTFPVLARNSNGGEQFKSKYYSFKYYNRALSGTEVAQNFNALRGRFGI